MESQRRETLPLSAKRSPAKRCDVKSTLPATSRPSSPRWLLRCPCCSRSCRTSCCASGSGAEQAWRALESKGRSSVGRRVAGARAKRTSGLSDSHAALRLPKASKYRSTEAPKLFTSRKPVNQPRRRPGAVTLPARASRHLRPLPAPFFPPAPFADFFDRGVSQLRVASEDSSAPFSPCEAVE
eukprot:scaffold495_cov243-Pinguiococcus_pyrenoidosus.AAC.34